MTRLELLKILVGQARANSFEFRRWYTTRLALPWPGADAAFELLSRERRYYALLFSHDFAQSFWKAGETMTFRVDAQSFTRRLADGTIGVVQRKPFMRRMVRADAWRYHLRELAVADEPLRYMRRYLRVDEELDDETESTPADEAPTNSAQPVIPPTLALARKTHERRKLAAQQTPPSLSKRGARPPGSRKKPA